MKYSDEAEINTFKNIQDYLLIKNLYEFYAIILIVLCFLVGGITFKLSNVVNQKVKRIGKGSDDFKDSIILSDI